MFEGVSVEDIAAAGAEHAACKKMITPNHPLIFLPIRAIIMRAADPKGESHGQNLLR